MIMVDPSTRQITDANSAAVGFYGYSHSQLCQMTLDQINTLPQDVLTKELEKARLREQNHFYFKHRLADGRVRDVEIFSSKIELDGKDLLHSIIHDITEQKEAENALLESEKRFRRMVEGAPDPIFIQSAGRFVYINQRALKLFGASSEEELLGLNVMERIHPDFIALAAKRVETLNVKREGVHTPMEVILLRLDGSEVWAETTGEPISYQGQPGALVFARDITDRKIKDATLKNERERMANILEGTRAGTWEWNVQTGEVVFNERWAQMAGYTLEELAPVSINTWMQLIHPDDLKKSENLLSRHFKGELDFYECEARMKHKKGHWIWVIDRGKVISRTPDGQPLLMSGTHQDITEGKNALIELEHMHQLMHYIIEHDRSTIAVHDRDLKYVFVSQRYLDAFNVKEQDIIGKHHYEVFPDIPEKWKMIHQRALNGEVSSSEEDFFERSDGSIFWTRWECRPWYTSEANIGGIIIYSEVINDRKQKELEIKKLNTHLQLLIEAVKALASALTYEAVEKVVMPAVRQLTGADGTSFIIREKDQCYYADEEAIAPLWKGRRFALDSCISGWTMIHNQPAMVEDIYVDARIPVDAYRPTFVKSLLMVPIHTTQPFGAIGVYWKEPHVASELEQRLIETLADATGRTLENINLYNRLEERVRQRTGQLEALNKELETFTYSVSHDLKAPLRGIDGYSKLLSDLYSGSLNDEAKFFISTIRNSTQQMNELIDDLLEYSRLERSKMVHEPVQVKALVDSIVASFGERASEKQVHLVNEIPQISVRADVKGITIVLRNLIENAIKFSGVKPEALVRIGMDETDTMWRIWVADNGIGFDMKYGQRIFEIFQRLHRAEEYPGTGIGLAMVSKAMQRMNGRVWAESEPGKGARFFIELPKG